MRKPFHVTIEWNDYLCFKEIKRMRYFDNLRKQGDRAPECRVFFSLSELSANMRLQVKDLPLACALKPDSNAFQPFSAILDECFEECSDLEQRLRKVYHDVVDIEFLHIWLNIRITFGPDFYGFDEEDFSHILNRFYIRSGRCGEPNDSGIG